jgi:hypothetical protein
MLVNLDFKMISVSILKKFCNKAKIKNYSKFKKEECFTGYNKYLATIIIQRCYRKYLYKNAVDSITLDEVSYPCFIYRVKTGKCFFYSYDSIIKYIMKSGKVVDPCTRNIYSDDDLIRLDTQAKKHFPEKNFKSTLKIKKNENYAKRIRNRENEILTYQMRLDELTEILVSVVVSDIFFWDIQQVVIDNVEYSNIQSYINTISFELKGLYTSLKTYDHFSAKCYKDTLSYRINELPENKSFFVMNNFVQRL